MNRVHTERYPYVLLYGHTHGRRPKGRPRKKWVDNIREDSADMDTIRDHLPHFGQDIMEEHCSAYGLPTRGVIAIVATVISQISQVKY